MRVRVVECSQTSVTIALPHTQKITKKMSWAYPFLNRFNYHILSGNSLLRWRSVGMWFTLRNYTYKRTHSEHSLLHGSKCTHKRMSRDRQSCIAPPPNKWNHPAINDCQRDFMFLWSCLICARTYSHFTTFTSLIWWLVLWYPFHRFT